MEEEMTTFEIETIETVPVVNPDENDPFSVPGPKVNPTPKGIKKVFKFCNIYIL